jgi:hypothetical protein
VLCWAPDVRQCAARFVSKRTWLYRDRGIDLRAKAARAAAAGSALGAAEGNVHKVRVSRDDIDRGISCKAVALYVSARCGREACQRRERAHGTCSSVASPQASNEGNGVNVGCLHVINGEMGEKIAQNSGLAASRPMLVFDHPLG